MEGSRIRFIGTGASPRPAEEVEDDLPPRCVTRAYGLGLWPTKDHVDHTVLSPAAAAHRFCLPALSSTRHSGGRHCGMEVVEKFEVACQWVARDEVGTGRVTGGAREPRCARMMMIAWNADAGGRRARRETCPGRAGDYVRTTVP